MCQLLQQKLQILAPKFAATKFVKIRSEEAIPNYPHKNLPTLLIYRKGDVAAQFVGGASLGGEAMTAESLEWKLKKVGAIESDMEEAPSETRSNVVNMKKGYQSRALNMD